MRRRYKVTASLIGWAQTWNQPCIYVLVQDCGISIAETVQIPQSYTKPSICG